MTVSVRPDGRGRVQLGSHIARDKEYLIDVSPDGTITLSPIALVLTEEAYRDFLNHPAGFARLVRTADELRAGTLKTIPGDQFWAEVNADVAGG